MKYLNKKVTYADIAKEAEVSIATVSRVINRPDLVKNKTVQQVNDAIKKLNNEPAGTEDANVDYSAVQRPSILCIVPNIGNPFYSDVIRGIKTAAEFYNYNLFIMDTMITHSNLEHILKIIAQYHYAGLIVLIELSQDILEQLNAIAPVVQCSEYHPTANFPYVSIDNFRISKIAVDYLIAAGSRKIAIVSNDPSIYNYSRLRIAAYKQALEEAGIPVDPQRILIFPSSEYNYSVATSAISSLLQLKDCPDSFFCTSDYLAAATIRSCIHMGLRVPDDVMVVGFDNIDISILTTPTITTVSQPRFDIGYTSCKYLMDIIADPNLLPQQTFLPAELIIRDSTS